MRQITRRITRSLSRAVLLPLLLGALTTTANAQRGGGMNGMPGMAMMGHDSTTMADMAVVHELVMNHDRVSRTVTNLPNGIRTVTESSDPRLARLLKGHVATMGARVEHGRDPGLPMETAAQRTLFRNGDKITTRADTTATGVIVVQTSNDPETVAALQKHAEEVTDLVREGMAAMHRAMMASGGGTARGGMGGMMHGGATDSAFAAMQMRGADPHAMGVDQYTSVHHFDALPDGGRIELQREVDDSVGVAQIRRHLREIAAEFAKGDFRTPAFVHDQQVPGTAVMAARRDAITYSVRDLPRGGEVRIRTTDPEALAAVHEFIAFQRQDHRTGGAENPGHHKMDGGKPRLP